MPHPKTLPQSVLTIMRLRLFDLSTDGVLVYRDSMIGALENKEKQIAVRLSGDPGYSGLWVGADVEQWFGNSPTDAALAG